MVIQAGGVEAAVAVMEEEEEEEGAAIQETLGIIEVNIHRCIHTNTETVVQWCNPQLPYLQYIYECTHAHMHTLIIIKCSFVLL